MTVKVLEAQEEKDRLILSNKKTAFETNKKLSYTVRLAPPLAAQVVVRPTGRAVCWAMPQWQRFLLQCTLDIHSWSSHAYSSGLKPAAVLESLMTQASRRLTG